MGLKKMAWVSCSMGMESGGMSDRCRTRKKEEDEGLVFVSVGGIGARG